MRNAYNIPFIKFSKYFLILSGIVFSISIFLLVFKGIKTSIDFKGGTIINISTVSVRTGMTNRLPYITSKQGVMGLTHNVARELGPWNIRCNAILPGLIDNTRGRAILARKAEADGKTLEETEAEYLKYISMRCWIEPKEVGDLVVFLSSEKAKHISGQFIAVDGHMEWEA